MLISFQKCKWEPHLHTTCGPLVLRKRGSTWDPALRKSIVEWQSRVWLCQGNRSAAKPGGWVPWKLRDEVPLPLWVGRRCLLTGLSSPHSIAFTSVKWHSVGWHPQRAGRRKELGDLRASKHAGSEKKIWPLWLTQHRLQLGRGWWQCSQLKTTNALHSWIPSPSTSPLA